MHKNKYDVRRQTDSRIEKVLGVYSGAGQPFPSQHLGWLRTHVDSYGYGKFRTAEAVQALITYTKENNMTPLQAATNRRDVLVAERDKNRATTDEFREATETLSQRNAAINVELRALADTIADEQAKEREAKHKAMADELRAAGYKVEAVTKTKSILDIRFPTDKFFITDPCFQFLGTDISIDGVSPAAYNSIKQMFTATSGGGKGGSVTSPVAAAPASAKLGGVHGVGEGWYSPIVYDSQGVKLNHDFAINTRDHHEARNQWWLKHVPSGRLTKGFPDEAEAGRWIRARTHYKVPARDMVLNYTIGTYNTIK